MPPIALLIFYVSAFYPFMRAWFALRGTSLRHAVLWAMAAWLCWGPVLTGFSDDQTLVYIALTATACAGVAVLGARRPHVMAWNFVVLGLFSVMMLPVVEGFILGARPLGAVRLVFIAVTFAVGVGNYLPTRFGPAALLVGMGGGGALLAVLIPEHVGPLIGRLALLAAPWVALLCTLRRRRAASELDRVWLDFRDRFGLFWALRVQEQFNSVARNNGWPVTLGWSGCKRAAGQTDEATMLADFRALLRRFV